VKTTEAILLYIKSRLDEIELDCVHGSFALKSELEAIAVELMELEFWIQEGESNLSHPTDYLKEIRGQAAALKMADEEIEKLRNEIVFLESELRDERIPPDPSGTYFNGGKL